jgi:catechol 2,3-dioxygenase-like lactoylglutathione lyase family enzyme
MGQLRAFDHVGITVADLDVATAFFVGLGLEVEGRTFVEGECVTTDRWPASSNGCDHLRNLRIRAQFADDAITRRPEAADRSTADLADLAVVVRPLVHHQAQHMLVRLAHLGGGSVHNHRPFAPLQGVIEVGDLVGHCVSEIDDVVGDDAAAVAALYPARRVQCNGPEPSAHSLWIGNAITEADEVQPCVLHGVVDIGGAAQNSARRGFHKTLEDNDQFGECLGIAVEMSLNQICNFFGCGVRPHV